MNVIIPKKPAERQQDYRSQLLKDLGLKPVSWLLTPPERAYLCQAFVKRYGHALTVNDRRKHAKQVNQPTQSQSHNQLGLL